MLNNVIHFQKARVKATKAIILSRVSSKEQEEGYSIEAQNHRLETYCVRSGLQVVKVFTLTESSIKGDRKDFMAMINFAKRQKEIIAIVADKIDRVQRSFNEMPMLDALIKEDQIELHFTSENMVIHRDSIGHEKTKWSLGVIVAESFILNMVHNVKRSLEQKIRLGECIGLVPIGYINVKDSRNRGDVIVDIQRADLVKRTFEQYSTGAFTLKDIQKMTQDWGLRNRNKKQKFLSKTQIHKIMTNPFYYGKMVINGNLYTHKYEPIITKHLFDQCQDVLNGWKKKPLMSGKKQHIFRGLLTCSISGRVVTTEIHKKTYANGKTGQWAYLRCTNPQNPNKFMWVREDQIVKQVEHILAELYIAPKTLAEIRSVLRGIDDAEKEFFTGRIDELKLEQRSIQNKLDSMMDLLIDGVIQRSDYEVRRRELLARKENAEKLLEDYKESDDSFKDCLSNLLEIGSRSSDWFIGSETEQKRLVLNLIFQNLSLKGDKLLYSFRKPFNDFRETGKMKKWREIIDAIRTNPELRREIISLCQQHKIHDLPGIS